jgi:hypothetical protein
MTHPSTNPRVLIVTPEVTCLPSGMGNLSNYLSVKAGGIADFYMKRENPINVFQVLKGGGFDV